MHIPTTSYREVEFNTPFIARTVPIRASMLIQKEGKEMLTMRPKSNHMGLFLEMSAYAQDNLVIIFGNRYAEEECPQVPGRSCPRRLWKPEI
jgi:hypothetical protein